jgi:hypothetical protein
LPACECSRPGIEGPRVSVRSSPERVRASMTARGNSAGAAPGRADDAAGSPRPPAGLRRCFVDPWCNPFTPHCEGYAIQTNGREKRVGFDDGGR